MELNKNNTSRKAQGEQDVEPLWTNMKKTSKKKIVTKELKTEKLH